MNKKCLWKLPKSPKKPVGFVECRLNITGLSHLGEPHDLRTKTHRKLIWPPLEHYWVYRKLTLLKNGM